MKQKRPGERPVINLNLMNLKMKGIGEVQRKRNLRPPRRLEEERSPNKKTTSNLSDPLSPVLHPGWSSASDLQILEARKNRTNFSDIAKQLERSTISVVQRCHRLRTVYDIEALLNDYGGSSKSYDAGGGHLSAEA